MISGVIEVYAGERAITVKKVAPQAHGAIQRETLKWTKLKNVLIYTTARLVGIVWVYVIHQEQCNIQQQQKMVR